jgi:glycosyltransferase involved in cell wall biosynthesis
MQRGRFALSGLFNAGARKKQHSAAGHSSIDSVGHLDQEVASSDPDSYPLFDVTYYQRRYGPSVATFLTPLEHFLQNWRCKAFNPHPLFDVEYYLNRYPQVADSSLDPMTHYLQKGAEAGYNPHPLFQTAFYYCENPDVKNAGCNALVHYLECGGVEGRDPNPWFDSSYYCEHNPDVVREKLNPLLHYVLYGAQEGRDPHPLFRAKQWASMRSLPEDGSFPLIDFVNRVENEGAHPLQALQLRDRPRVVNVIGSAGVNLIGWPRLEIGLAEYLREIARAFAVVYPTFGIRDVSLMGASVPGDDSVSSYIVPDCMYNTNLFVVNADNMTTTCSQIGFENVANRFNIALWAWELSNFPDAWRKEMSVVDEIWAFSSFNQECFALKADVPVVYMRQPVTLSADAGLSRSDFGIPDDRFIFLFQFDFSGFIDRKNPYASIAAFRKAFPHGNSEALLVIKTNNADRYPEQLRQLTEAIGDDPDILVIHGTFRRDKVMSLMSLADAFVSLHRSEGFGRSLAEAMLLGKPVIATNYSGNTDFMRQDNSCLVNYSLVPVEPGQYPFAEGQVWADADIEHAAWYMRRLLNNPPYRQLISRKGQQTIADEYNLLVTGTRYLQRLQLLGLMDVENADRSALAFVQR